MNNLSPFVVRVGISQRSTHLTDLVVRHSPMVSDYRLWVAKTLNDSYGPVVDSGLFGTATGGDIVMTVRTGGLAQSPGISRRGAASTAEVRRGQTSFILDQEDYMTVSGNVPSDDEYMFARVQENRKTTGWAAVPGTAVKNANMPIRGSILVVPNPGFYGHASSVLSLYGLAPAGSDCAIGVPPVIDATVQKPMPMHIVFPRPMGSLTVRNVDAGNSLLVSFGMGQPMIEVAKGDTILPTGGGYSLPGITEIILAMDGAGGGCKFSLDGVIGMQW